MKCEYEGALFLTSTSNSLEKHLIKLKIKKMIGRFLGKPYLKDPYFSFCEGFLSKISSPVVVDVGANIGTTIFPLAKKFPEARFIGIEPLKKI